MSFNADHVNTSDLDQYAAGPTPSRSEEVLTSRPDLAEVQEEAIRLLIEGGGHEDLRKVCQVVRIRHREHGPPHREQLSRTIKAIADHADANGTANLLDLLAMSPSDDGLLDALSRRTRWNDAVVGDTPIRVRVSSDLVRFLDPRQGALGGQFVNEMLPRLRADLKSRHDVSIPGIRLSQDEGLPERSFSVRILGVPRLRVCIPHCHLLVDAGADGRDLPKAELPWLDGDAWWVPDTELLGLSAPTLDLLDVRGIVAESIAHAVSVFPHAFMTPDMLEAAE